MKKLARVNSRWEKALKDIRVLLLVLLGLPCLLPAARAEDAEPPSCRLCPDEIGWHGSLETGFGYQNQDDIHFGRYDGLTEEGVLLLFDGDVRYTDEDGGFVEAEWLDLGIDATHIDIEGGRLGTYELGFEFDQIPYYREDSGASPYLDLGDGRLVLPSGWSAASSTQVMPDLDAALRPINLQTERERNQVSAAFYPVKNWQIKAYVQREEKQGIRDYGASFGFNQNVILPLPVDYITDEIGVSMDYATEDWQLDLSVKSSSFDNRQYDIEWQNPFEDISSPTSFGRLGADSPDNEFQQISAVVGYQLSSNTRISGRLSSARLTQDEIYLAATINDSLGSIALPVSNLDGQVDTSLASLRLVSRPLPALRLDASLSNSQRDNKTPINTYSIVTTDQVVSGDRNNRPYSFDQQLLRLKAAYRLDSSMTVSGGYDNDQVERDYSSAEETEDSSWWLKLQARPLPALETSLKYSRSDRDASAYFPLSDIDPLFDYPDPDYSNNVLMRVYNLADRQRDSLALRLAYSTENMSSIGFDLDYYQDEYAEMYLGLQQADGFTATASLGTMLSESVNASMYYSYDRLRSEQKGSERLLPTAGDDLWLAKDRHRTDSIGISLDWMVIEDELDLGVELNLTDFRGEMTYSDASSLPELETQYLVTRLYGQYQLEEDVMALKFEIRHERFQEQDWTEDGTVNLLPSLLSLGIANSDTETTLAFVTLYYQF